MNSSDIARLRMHNQQLTGSSSQNVKELVGWMGALQAQDYAMVKWAVALRLTGATEETVESTIAAGKILRTHLLRPTWHLVSADDIHWMLQLTAPRIKASMKSRHKQLGMTASLVNRSNDIISEALSGGKHLSRAKLKTRLERANIDTSQNRLSHLLLCAELDGLICSGADQSYALLSERVPEKTHLHKEEALAVLAKTYFTSHGPATVYDFSWWSGLTVTQARKALEMIKEELLSETVGDDIYWFPETVELPSGESETVHLLPAFDEYIVSYKNRSAVIPNEHKKKAISNNGIFRPVILVDGQVAGIWKRTVKSGKVTVIADFHRPVAAETLNSVEIAARSFGKFLGKETDFTRTYS